MFVTNYMSTDPIAIGPEVFLPEARAILNEYYFRHLPVVDNDNKLIGIITDRDLRSAYPSSVISNSEQSLVYEQIEKTTVQEIMSTMCISLRVDSTLDDALLLFEKEKVGALPVIETSEKLVGIFSIRDLIRAYKKLFGVAEKGSTLITIKDDGTKDCMSRLTTLLEYNGVAITRLIRHPKSDGSHTIYVRLNTFKITSVLNLLSEGGFKMSQL